jgi:hypothetical protein
MSDEMNVEMLSMLKDFIKENNEQHKEIFDSVNELKLQVGRLESADLANSKAKEACVTWQNGMEQRVRDLELNMAAVKNLPKAFQKLGDEMKKLAIRVYLGAGAMTVIIILAGWMLKNS